MKFSDKMAIIEQENLIITLESMTAKTINELEQARYNYKTDCIAACLNRIELLAKRKHNVLQRLRQLKHIANYDKSKLMKCF